MNCWYLTILISFFTPALCKAQIQNYIGQENAFDVILFKSDSTVKRKNVKGIKTFYQKQKDKRKLVEQKDFDQSGKANKVTVYNYGYPNDSIVIAKIDAGKEIYWTQTKISPTSLNSDFIADDAELLFPKAYYKLLIDSVKKASLYIIDKKYFLSEDSAIKVITYINDQQVEVRFLMNPFSTSDQKAPEILEKWDTAYVRDTMILESKKAYEGLNHIRKVYYFKHHIVKDEVFKLDNLGAVRDYRYSYWNYNNKMKLIYFEDGLRDDSNKVVKFTVKETTYTKNGQRIETEDVHGADGRIDSRSEYNTDNNVVRYSRYYYEYVGRSDSLAITVAETLYRYNAKGLIKITTDYLDGALLDVYTYDYIFYE